MAIGERWTLAKIRNGDRLGFTSARTDQGFEDFKASFPYAITVAWNFTNDDGDGLPDDALMDNMDQLEDELKAAFETIPIGALAIVETGGGCRSWVFYCADSSALEIAQRSTAPRAQSATIHVDSEFDPSWSLLHEITDEFQNWAKSEGK